MREKYYWVNRASVHHIEKMKQAGACEGEPEEMLRSGNPRYISRIVSEQESRDGGWTNVFLIEYDIYNPSQGIYFGCKSVTKPGYDHEAAIEGGIEEWTAIRDEAVKRLNNTFVDKDFTYRFKVTDNTADGTFWPFWLSLYEEEGVEEVGCRALRIIAGVYYDFKKGKTWESRQKATSNRKQVTVRTAFTREAYDKLMQSVEENVKAVAGTDEGRIKGEMARKLMQTFISVGEGSGLLERTNSYELAWRMKSGLPDVEFKAMMKALFAEMERRLEVKGIRVPWGDLIRVMMRHDETAYKE